MTSLRVCSHIQIHFIWINLDKYRYENHNFMNGYEAHSALIKFFKLLENKEFVISGFRNQFFFSSAPHFAQKVLPGFNSAPHLAQKETGRSLFGTVVEGCWNPAAGVLP